MISYTQLVSFSIAGGAGGQVIFRSLAEGKKITLDSANQAVVDAADKGSKAAEGDDATAAKVKAEALQAGLDSLKE